MLSAGNVHDSKYFEPLLDAAPAIRTGRPGRPRRRPEKVHADKGYDYRRCRTYLHRRGIKVRIARVGLDSKKHLGRRRWVVERSVAWIVKYKRLDRRYDRTTLTMNALLTLAAAHTCYTIWTRRRNTF